MRAQRFALTALALGILLAGCAMAATLEHTVDQGAALAQDVAGNAPGFAAAAGSYAQDTAAPYAAQGLAQVDAAGAGAHDAYVQAEAAACPACHVASAQQLWPAATAIAVDAAALPDAPAAELGEQGDASLRAAEHGEVPDTAWLMPTAASSAAASEHAAASGGNTAWTAGVEFVGREAPALHDLDAAAGTAVATLQAAVPGAPELPAVPDVPQPPDAQVPSAPDLPAPQVPGLPAAPALPVPG
jgi:hypothetical protein